MAKKQTTKSTKAKSSTKTKKSSKSTKSTKVTTKTTTKTTKRNKKDIKMEDVLEAKFKESGMDTSTASLSDEYCGNERVIKMDVGQATMDYSRLFGANKNLYRTVPRLQDGLKPGLGRMLYMWWNKDGRLQNTKPETLAKRKYYKAQRLTSETMALHPHSDSGISETLGNLGQPWSNNIMYIDPQGSYGNQHGDQVGASRYIEARMSEFAIDCFFSDFDKYCIPMKPSYDGDIMEPEFLPSKYPNVLFNPQFSGIGLTQSPVQLKQS